ncbi:MAG TPA: hypothetical protein VGQ36_15020 [Thermoanaerobaculia bacterium]|jgi:VWFA-related protein|nr:hypothetical protein [Thermoanaerobaculia bacterium]
MLAIALCAVLTAQIQETITVSRVVVDARVTDTGGEPIANLTAADFEVRIGGKKAVVESAEWIEDVGAVESSSRPVVEDPASEPLDDSTTRRLGRLLVFFVQTDFSRDSSRTEGQMSFMQHYEQLLETLLPEDRVAVFSFDSRLKFRLDFSSDRDAIREALRESLFINTPAEPPIVPSPSLASRLDREDMRRAAHSETGLLVVANALRSIPGPKTLLLLGWGLGERSMGGVRMKRQWGPARAALDAARVSIFALDTTNADYHDLEVGLISAAEQTGGFYAKTHVFPQIAIERLQRTLSGHYELTLRAVDELQPGSQELIVRVKRRGALVLAPSSVLIRR